MMWAWVLVGCYSETDFEGDLLAASCDKVEACGWLPQYGFDTVDDCLADPDRDATPTLPDPCDFDAKRAEECVDEYAATSCDDLQSGVVPESCTLACSGG